MEAQTCKKELLIEIPVDVVRKETDSVTNQYRKIARIPGFRKGHAPASLIQTHFRKDIQSEVVQSLVPKFFEDLVKGQNLAVVGQPQFDELKFEADQPLTIKASFEIYPTFELKEYKGLEVEEESAAVKDEDVNEVLEKMRERAATFEVVENRAAGDDDYLTVSYSGHDVKNPKVQPVESREAVVHIGAEGTVPAFTENLKGAKTGEVREFEVPYAEDYPQKALAGKTYAYRVEVTTIKKKVLPALDDDLAKTVSELKTFDELRQKVRNDLQAARDERVKQETRQKLLEELITRHEFPVPEALVEVQLDRKLENSLGRLISQGIDPRSIDVDWHKVREESRPAAEKDVRGAMILEKIAEAEKIEISDAEVDEVIRDMAEEHHEPPAALKTRLTRDGALDRLKSSRRNQKALEIVFQSAKINRKSE